MATELTATVQCRFEVMYERHAKSVLAYFLRRCDSEMARDGTAEVFLIAWRRLPDVPEGDETIRWLYGTARRILANQRRAQARRGRLLDRIRSNGTPAEVSLDVAIVRREQDREVHEALRKLKGEDRELLRLALWEELPRDDLAAYLGCNRYAVAQWVHRATRWLAKVEKRRVVRENSDQRVADRRDRRLWHRVHGSRRSARGRGSVCALAVLQREDERRCCDGCGGCTVVAVHPDERLRRVTPEDVGNAKPAEITSRCSV